MLQQSYRTLGLIALVVGTACREAAAERPASDVPVVNVAPPATVSRPTIVTASGAIEARRSVDLAFEVPGRLTTVGPEAGQRVRRGQLLAQVDPLTFQLEAERLAVQAERGEDLSRRHRQLHEAGSLAENDLRQSLAIARQQQLAAELAAKRVRDTRLIAPISGDVAQRLAEAGEMVEPGRPVYSIVQLDTIDVKVGVAEGEIGQLKVGQDATISATAIAGRTFPGRIRMIAPRADPTTRTYEVTVSVPNPDRLLRAGMVAEASVSTGERTTALTVPGHAVLRDPQGAAVVYVHSAEDGRVRPRHVELGAPMGDAVEILRGLAPTDHVVVGGAQRVRAGMRVTVRVAPLERAGAP